MDSIKVRSGRRKMNDNKKRSTRYFILGQIERFHFWGYGNERARKTEQALFLQRQLAALEITRYKMERDDISTEDMSTLNAAIVLIADL